MIDRPSALRCPRAEKSGGTTGLRAFLLPNLLAPLPLPRPSSPSASAHIQASPVTQSLGKASAGHPTPAPGTRPRLRRPSAPPGPRPSVLEPSTGPHSQEEAHLLSSEGRGGAAGPCRGQDSEPARDQGGAEGPQPADSGSPRRRCSGPGSISLPLHSMTHQTWSTLLLSKMTGGKHYCRAHPFTDSVPTDGVNIQNSR